MHNKLSRDKPSDHGGFESDWQKGVLGAAEKNEADETSHTVTGCWWDRPPFLLWTPCV